MAELSAEHRAALARDRVVDITTTGRRSGEPRRIEIWQNEVDGTIYIAGTPGPRGWYANLLADPHFTVHIKKSLKVDLPAVAHPVTDPERRRPLMAEIVSRLSRTDQDVERWVRASPLVAVEFV